MRLALLVVFLGIGVDGFSQEEITWEDLNQVTFHENYVDSTNTVFISQAFSNELRSLDGKSIKIIGFLHVIGDFPDETYSISYTPFGNLCAPRNVQKFENIGIEIIDLQLTSSFRTDQILNFSGILKLNYSDPDHLIYMMEDCQINELD